MRRFFLVFSGVALSIAFIASLATGSTPLTILTAVVTFFASYLGSAVMHSISGPSLKIQFRHASDGRWVRIDNCDYSEAIEPKVFFDLVAPQPNGGHKLIKSSSTALSHLPKRTTGSKHTSMFIFVPELITSTFVSPEMKLVIGITSIHRNTNFRGLVTETVSFSAFHAIAPDAGEQAAA